MSIGTLIVFLDGTVINTALPDISTKLSATTSQLQWVVDSYILVLAGLLLLGGTIGDRFGRRRWMNVGLLFFVGGSVLGGLSNTIETLIAARAVQGLGAALVLPATLSIVTNVFDREERAKAIAIWTAVGGLGVGIGPAVGGYLVEHWDYSAAFWIHVPILALAGVGMLFVSESRDPRPVGLDVPGALTATLAVSSLVYGIIQGGESGWTSTRIVVALGISAVSFLAFAAIERRAAHPMLPLRFFRQRDFTGSVVALGIVFFAGIVLFFFLSQYWQLVQGRSPFKAGLMALPNAAAIITGSAVAQSLLPKVGPRRLVSTAMVIMGTGVAPVHDRRHRDIDPADGRDPDGRRVRLRARRPAAHRHRDGGGTGGGCRRRLGRQRRQPRARLRPRRRHHRIDRVAPLPQQRPRPADRQGAREVVDVASEGIGVVHVAANSMEPAVAAKVIDHANRAFVDAMTTGFWISVGFIAVGLATSLLLLPKQSRVTQVMRADDEELSPAAGTAVPAPVTSLNPAALQ